MNWLSSRRRAANGWRPIGRIGCGQRRLAIRHRSMRFHLAEIRLPLLLSAAAVDLGKVTDGQRCQFSCTRIRAHASGADHACAAIHKRARYGSIHQRGVAAAGAAVAGNHESEREELGRAFDLLSDARNHVYSVDFYVVDVTLLADSTLGESLRTKLAAGSRTNLLITGQQIELMAREHPETLAELRRSLEAGTASIVGGTFRSGGGRQPIAGIIVGRTNRWSTSGPSTFGP